MSRQLESRHFFRESDIVQRQDGSVGTVLDARTLYAMIAWADGRRDEVEQFDTAVVVLKRAVPQ